MKKIGNYFFCTTFMILMNIKNLQAQITLEHTFDSTAVDIFYCTDIGVNEYKYVFLDRQTNSFSLFNMNMTPFLTSVQLPVDDSIANGFTIMYITRTLFDCDSTTIEFAYENQYDVKHSFRVLRTDGTLLLHVDSANSPYSFGSYGGSHEIRPVQNTSGGTKLYLQKYGNNMVPQILVYALCGALPTTYYSIVSNNNTQVKVYPNPTMNELNFAIELPNNTEEFWLKVTDTNGKECEIQNVSQVGGKLSLNVSNYFGGTYFYTLLSKTTKYQSGKFVLSK